MHNSKFKIQNSIIILILILLFSAFFRLFRLDQLLGFWYDQGRDALVIWDLIHYHKFFLIGPVTGIEGIFLGPFYYYLITPLYFLGGGSPVFVAAGLSCLTVAAIYLIYLLGKEIFNKEVGLLSAFIYGFSYSLVIFSRWLANPNPLPFFTLLAMLCLHKFIKTHNSLFIIPYSFLIGLCLQLEAASAIFFLPATLIIVVWQRKNVKNLWVLIASFLAFSITLMPQIYFNFRHEGILVDAFKKFLIVDKSFELSIVDTIKVRVVTYFDVFFNNLYPNMLNLKLLSLASFSALIIFLRKSIFTKGGKFLLIWLLAPLVGFLFYSGNNGYVWGYYFTGVIPAFTIIFSAGLWFFAKKGSLPKLLVGVFLITFLSINVKSIITYLETGIGITLRAQIWAMDWIYKDTGKEEFNIDAYVPPQIYYSYSYLFRWYGLKNYNREPQTKLVKNLYTLYEPDGERPHLLKAWLVRQDTIGKLIKSDSRSDITVQKRERVKFSE